MSSNNINSVVFSGRLTHDPKLYEPGGESVYTLLRLAINRRVGKDKQRTIYYDVKAWNCLARACVEHLRKGGHVFAQGHLDQYDKPAEDAEEQGTKRWNFITAEPIEFGAWAKGQGEGNE